LSITYPTGLPSTSYIPIKQLNSDFQGFVSSFSPSDAPEAYISSALQQLLSKYPQITAGGISASISGPPTPIPGTPITRPGPPIASVRAQVATCTVTALGCDGKTISTVNSTRFLTMPTGFTGTTFANIALGLTYPMGLSTDSYITTKQLTADFQGFISAYPNPADPPEAYLSGALASMMNKYSQIPGGTLVGTINGPDTQIPGLPVPTPGSPVGIISVAIGTLNSTYASILGQSGPVSLINSTWNINMPNGFSGASIPSVSLGITYPTGLSASSYILNSQLTKDFQSSISNYPTPSDSPEAYLSVALQNILGTYPQMLGGSLSGSISGPPTTIPGLPTPIPGPPVGSVSVLIGQYSYLLGAIGIGLF